MTRKRVIGNKGGLPWRIADEIGHYRKLIEGKPIIMGRRTFEITKHPFAHGHDIVLTSSDEKFKNADVCRSMDEAIATAKRYGPDVFVIGGQQIFEQAIGIADRMLLSYVKRDYDGDAFFPKFNKRDWRVDKKEEFSEFTYIEYSRKRTR